MVRCRVQNITSSDTLTALVTACKTDYPDMSEAASIRLETMTIDTSKKRNAEEWIDRISDRQGSTMEGDMLWDRTSLIAASGILAFKTEDMGVRNRSRNSIRWTVTLSIPGLGQRCRLR